MRTDENILDDAFANNGLEDAYREITTKPYKAVLAAMKEAREEYAKEFAKFVTERCYQWHEVPKLWISIYHASEPEYTEQGMIDLFNQHLSAIEAEKERGKG